MIRYLHGLSALLFYLLGSGFFLAYVLFHNNIAVSLADKWMSVMDLPLLLVAMLYGGLSVYRSLQGEKHPVTGVILVISIPLALLFVAFLILNF